ncbi:Carbon catabolite repressor protein 4 homolog 4 [Linum perenne]
MLRSSSLLHQLPIAFSTARKTFLAKMSTTAIPMCPKFITVEGGEIYSRSKPDGLRFSVVSYNILAQDGLLWDTVRAYVKSSLFPHSPPACLKWKARCQSILTVLKSLEVDFFCLQEVDEYDSFYKPNMANHGYSSIYIQRTGQKRDGCGIFYRLDSAELLLEERLEYNDLINALGDEQNSQHVMLPNTTREDRGDPNDPLVRLKRDCVGIMAAFKLKGPFHNIVIVANTHLYWDPEWADVKLAQAKYLLSRLAKFKMLVSERFECAPSVILAGDFNSIPGDKVYQYLVSGDALDSTPSVECVDELPIPLRSLYADTRGEPPFTNCTPDFTNTLDYIFFSPGDQLKPVGILELPGAEDADVAGGLPNHCHPSDHLPIGAQFEISSA